MYTEDDMLMLSGIQHYMFCPRQWALIHIDQQWEDNRLTMEGHLLHANVDNPAYRQKNGNIITLRSVAIASKKLGLYGFTDAVELHPVAKDEVGIHHKSYKGVWMPYPIEYKRGKPKRTLVDEVQLAAQVMCLEEMYGIDIPSGALYYGETRHREVVTISQKLRDVTMQCSESMHRIFNSNVVPNIAKSSRCRNCSLIDICMPSIEKCSKVSTYLKKYLYEEAAERAICDNS